MPISCSMLAISPSRQVAADRSRCTRPIRTDFTLYFCSLTRRRSSARRSSSSTPSSCSENDLPLTSRYALPSPSHPPSLSLSLFLSRALALALSLSLSSSIINFSTHVRYFRPPVLAASRDTHSRNSLASLTTRARAYIRALLVAPFSLSCRVTRNSSVRRRSFSRFFPLQLYETLRDAADSERGPPSRSSFRLGQGEKKREKERERRERERERECVCVCVRERERERERLS